MPYPEFRSWQIFSLLEPFGFHDTEYRTAAQLAMLYNVNRSKGKAKDVKDFMREPDKAILEELRKQNFNIDDYTREEIIAMIKRDLGI